MSSDLLRIIPTDPNWVPGPSAAEAAAALVRSTIPNAREISMEILEEVVFVDQGGNFESVMCPGCGTMLDTQWWQERMDEAFETAFTNLGVVTPCCSRTTSLNDLTYNLPAGFARFIIEVAGPGRDVLEPSELEPVATALGHPVRQVLARY
jgi:DNA-directed RNA polymerase subunit N (RpoN/RPB10)